MLEPPITQDTADPAQEPATPLCPQCLTASAPDRDFCETCGGPLTAMTTLDPIKAIQAQGWAYRCASSGRTSPVVFWGMVLLFGPALVLTLIAIVEMLFLDWGWLRFDTAVGVGFAAVIALLYTLILRRLLRNRLRQRRYAAGRCGVCKYDLRGLPEARCPNCGTRFDRGETKNLPVACD